MGIFNPKVARLAELFLEPVLGNIFPEFNVHITDEQTDQDGIDLILESQKIIKNYFVYVRVRFSPYEDLTFNYKQALQKLIDNKNKYDDGFAIILKSSLTFDKEFNNPLFKESIEYIDFFSFQDLLLLQDKYTSDTFAQDIFKVLNSDQNLYLDRLIQKQKRDEGHKPFYFIRREYYEPVIQQDVSNRLLERWRELYGVKSS